MTFTRYGVVDFSVQYWTGSQWATVPVDSVGGNNKVWRRVTFPAITTAKVRVIVNAALASYSRLVEVEAWGGAGGAAGADLRWLVTDQVGTPRMALDRTGGLTAPDGRSGVSRHDYLPLGGLRELDSSGESRTPRPHGGGRLAAVRAEASVQQ